MELHPGLYFFIHMALYLKNFYRQTKDIKTLRRILGHSDISTTTIYVTLANIDAENGMKSFKGFIWIILFRSMPLSRLPRHEPEQK